MTRTYRCGHPNTVENTVSNGPQGIGRCKVCKLKHNIEVRLKYRVRNLPTQLERAREKVARLEAEARKYGFTDLVEKRA
jgi:hypothetical protein